MWILLLAAATSSASALTNGDFESGALWDQPSGWTTSWTASSSGCATTYPLPVFGPLGCISGPGACGTWMACNVDVNLACGYARVVDNYTVPNTLGGLQTVYGGSYACELFSGRPSAGCGGASGGAQFSEVAQTFLLPNQTGQVGACLSLAHACVVQWNGNPVSTDAHYTVDMLLNGTAYLTQSVYGNTAGIQIGGTDGDGNTWRYMPWQTFAALGCLPFGSQIEVRARAYSSDTVATGRFCIGYLDSVAFNNCCPESPTATATGTTSLTPTITCTPTISCTATTTGSLTGSPTATGTESPVPTPRPTYVGAGGPKDVPYLRMDRKIYNGTEEYAYVQWILDRNTAFKIVLYDSAGEFVRTVWDGYSAQGVVDQARFPFTSPDNKKSPRPLAQGIYLVRLVANDFVLSTRFAIVRGPDTERF